MKRLSFLVLFLLLLGCSKQAKEKTSPHQPHHQEISINIGSEPQTLDPRRARSLNDINLIKMLMDGLTRIDKEGLPTPSIAGKIDLSPDKRSYTFTLRKALWSNGDPITAYDFAYAWKKSLSPDTISPNSNLLYCINNAEEVKQGKLPFSLLGIDTPNPNTLIVTLKKPLPYFLELVTHPIFFPVNSRTDRSNASWSSEASSFVSNGPFMLDKWKHQSELIIKKNPTYWDQEAVFLSKIHMTMVREDSEFSMFENGELHWAGSPLSMISLSTIPSLKKTNKLIISPASATYWIRINVDHSPFHSKKLRQAFAYAIDRQSIVDHITQGGQIVATGIAPPTMQPPLKPHFQDHHIKRAKELFQEALEEGGLTNETLPTIHLTYVAIERAHLLAQAFQSQWKDAFDIAVHLDPVETNILFDRLNKKDYTLSLGAYFPAVNDPMPFLELFQSKDTGLNNTNWEENEYANLIEAASLAQTPEKRQELLEQSEAFLMDAMPIIPIFHYTFLSTKDDALKNVVLTYTGTIDFKWAYLDR